MARSNSIKPFDIRHPQGPNAPAYIHPDDPGPVERPYNPPVANVKPGPPPPVTVVTPEGMDGLPAATENPNPMPPDGQPAMTGAEHLARLQRNAPPGVNVVQPDDSSKVILP